MFGRILSSAAAGLTITAGLLILMQYLIEVSEAGGDPRPRHVLGTWLPTIDDSEVVVKEELLDRIAPPVELPQSKPQLSPGEHTVLIGVKPLAAPPTEWRLTGLKNTDGGLMTIVAVQPNYPQKASERGLEGHVIVQFDVTTMGTVSNAVVVESSSRLFERAAINAAMRFRFKPRIVDGVPQESYGVQRLFTFEMDSD